MSNPETPTDEKSGAALGWSDGAPALKNAGCCLRCSVICGMLISLVLAMIGIFLLHAWSAGANWTPTCDTSVYDPLVVGTHRGDIRGGQENSYDAVNATFEAGLSMAEIDVRMTTDGIAVLFHDNNTIWLTGEEGSIETMTWDEVSQLQYLEEISTGNYTERRPIARLDEILNVFCPLGGNFMIDVKDPALVERMEGKRGYSSQLGKCGISVGVVEEEYERCTWVGGGWEGADRPIHDSIFEAIDQSPCDNNTIVFAEGNPQMAHDLYYRQAIRAENGKKFHDLWFYYVDESQIPPGNMLWVNTRYWMWITDSSHFYYDYDVHDPELQAELQAEGYCYGLFDLNFDQISEIENADILIIDFEQE